MYDSKLRASDTEWTVTDTMAGRTVSATLRLVMPGHSWSEVRALIRSRRVQLNQSLCVDEARRVNAGDILQVRARSAPPPPDDSHVELRYIDQSIVVIDKPAGMLSLRHAAEIHWPAERRLLQPSAEEVVLRLIRRHSRMREDPSRFPPARRRQLVRSVHRIDRDTSGLLVFARTHLAQQKLIEQFSQHTIRRVYQAVVLGTPKESRIESRLVRDRGDGLRGSTSNPNDGKRAVTFVRPVQSFGDFSIVECTLETGRTHQIRIHLTESGHPVCGDRVYRSAFQAAASEDHSVAPRLALHARELAFAHPESGEQLQFVSEFPRDLSTFLARLRGETTDRE